MSRCVQPRPRRRAIWRGLVLLAAASCAPGERFRAPRNQLERSLSYHELQAGSDPRTFSGAGEGGSQRVPLPACIDVDSAVEIKLDKSRLGAGTDEKLGADIAELKARAEALTTLVDRAIALSDLQQQVSAAFAAKEAAIAEDHAAALEQFLQRRREFGRRELELQQQLIDALPDVSEQDDLDRAMAGRRGYRGVREYLQQRVGGFLAQQRTLAAAVQARASTLEITALLMSSRASEPTQIHLPGYDTLADGQWRPYDRTGIHLTPEQQKELQGNWEATVKLSQSLQNLLDGDAKTLELLAALAPSLAISLETFLAEATGIADSLRTMRAELPKFVAKVRSAVATAPDAEIERLRRSLELFARASDLRDRAQGLAARWRQVRADQLLGLTTDTWSYFDDVTKVVSLVRSADWEEVVRGIVTSLSAEVATTLRNDAELAPFFAAADAALATLEPALKKARSVIDSLPKPGTAPITLPKGISVPIDDATDTGFDLTMIGREPGDQVRITALLRNGEQVLDRAEATFRIESFGWRGELSPAVVLLRPDQLAGAPERFGFAPTLSWLHSYTPRPDETGLGVGVLRGLQPAVGMHAAFLNFDPQREVEFGLGLTLALWRGRLQFGGGYNLMAENGEDGRFYYFVGSDLIGLLQQLGLGR